MVSGRCCAEITMSHAFYANMGGIMHIRAFENNRSLSPTEKQGVKGLGNYRVPDSRLPITLLARHQASQP